MARLGWDLAWGKLADNEVARARELREIVTSLGPAYIKLGQALSIRPDILSPSAMYEMQKLCDKVSLLCRILKTLCCCMLVTHLACHALNVSTTYPHLLASPAPLCTKNMLQLSVAYDKQ